jgi:holo-[acyl-carrier protein] synthase
MKTILSSIGVGIDIELIAKFSMPARSASSGFLARVFTRRELDYCFSKKDPAQHLAARFSAKESVIKAVHNVKSAVKAGFKDIEIVNDKSGAPHIFFLSEHLKGYQAKISLSHAKDYVSTCAIVYKDENLP